MELGPKRVQKFSLFKNVGGGGSVKIIRYIRPCIASVVFDTISRGSGQARRRAKLSAPLKKQHGVSSSIIHSVSKRVETFCR